MKNILIILLISAGALAISATTATQKIGFKNNPTSYSKVEFAKLLAKRNISQQMNTKPIIKSLGVSNGKWVFYATDAQVTQMNKFSNKKPFIKNGVIVSEEHQEI